MSEAVIIAIITAISSSGICSLIVYLLQRKDKETGVEKIKTKMLLGIAHSCMISTGDAYIKRGWISHAEYDELNEYLYKPYKALGGSGTASLEKVMEDVEKLQFKTI